MKMATAVLMTLVCLTACPQPMIEDPTDSASRDGAQAPDIQQPDHTEQVDAAPAVDSSTVADTATLFDTFSLDAAAGDTTVGDTTVDDSAQRDAGVAADTTPRDVASADNGATDTRLEDAAGPGGCVVLVHEVETLFTTNSYWTTCPGVDCESDYSSSASATSHLLTYENVVTGEDGQLSATVHIPTAGDYYLWGHSPRGGTGRGWQIRIDGADSSMFGGNDGWHNGGLFPLPTGDVELRLIDAEPDGYWAYPDALILSNDPQFDPQACPGGGVQADDCADWCQGPSEYSCLGVPPANASLCPGADQDLAGDTGITLAESCTDIKCQYSCSPNHIIDNGSCVLDPSATEICEATGDSHCYYIAPNGSDSDNGSFATPFASTNPIIDTITAGDYIYFRGGTYGPAAKGQIVNYADWLPDYYAVAYIRRSGEENRPITFKAYPGELPRLDLELINPEYDPSSLSDGATDAFHVRGADYIKITGFEIVHGSIFVGGNSQYTWIEDNHVHDLLTNRSNNGLIMLYFTQHAYVRGNHLHDTYSRSISDGNGGQMLNTTRSHEDAEHNGCITTLSGDGYVGYGRETSGPFELVNNDIHDCPVHLFIKNSQGQIVNDNGINLYIKDNFFHGSGRLGIAFNAANVLFENNLFKDIGGISRLGKAEILASAGDDPRMNEISARNITFRNNVFTNTTYVAQLSGLGFLVANGVYSTAFEDKFKFHNNVVVITPSAASTAGTMGWNQSGFVLGNSYSGMIDDQQTPSKTLSRLDSVNNCIINPHGASLAFLKRWYNGSETITGYDHATAQTLFNINGSGDLFPTDTAATSHFADPEHNNYAIAVGSPCSAITDVGLSNPALFVED